MSYVRQGRQGLYSSRSMPSLCSSLPPPPPHMSTLWNRYVSVIWGRGVWSPNTYASFPLPSSPTPIQPYRLNQGHSIHSWDVLIHPHLLMSATRKSMKYTFLCTRTSTSDSNTMFWYYVIICSHKQFSLAYVSVAVSIELFIEVQEFSPTYDLAPTSPPSPLLSRQQVVSLSQSFLVSQVELTNGRGGRVWGRSHIIRRRESLVLYKSFNTLC